MSFMQYFQKYFSFDFIMTLQIRLDIDVTILRVRKWRFTEIIRFAHKYMVSK